MDRSAIGGGVRGGGGNNSKGRTERRSDRDDRAEHRDDRAYARRGRGRDHGRRSARGPAEAEAIARNERHRQPSRAAGAVINRRCCVPRSPLRTARSLSRPGRQKRRRWYCRSSSHRARPSGVPPVMVVGSPQPRMARSPDATIRCRSLHRNRRYDLPPVPVGVVLAPADRLRPPGTFSV